MMRIHQKKLAFITILLFLVSHSGLLANIDTHQLARNTSLSPRLSFHFQYADTASNYTILQSVEVIKNKNLLSRADFYHAYIASEFLFEHKIYENALAATQIALFSADSLAISLKELMPLYTINSVLLEETKNSEEALKLWRTVMKDAEFSNDTVSSLKSLYQMVRIFNDLNLPEKSLLFLLAFNDFNEEYYPVSLVNSLNIERIRYELLKGNMEKASLIFGESILRNNKFETENTIQFTLQLFRIGQLIPINQTLLDSLVTKLENSYQRIENESLKKFLAQMLGDYYLNVDKVKAVFYLMQAEYNEMQKSASNTSFLNAAPEYIVHKNKLLSKEFDAVRQKNSINWTIVLFILLMLLFFTFRLMKKMKKISEDLKIVISNFTAEELSLKEHMESIDHQLEGRTIDRITSLNEELNERERIDNELNEALEKAEDANYHKNAFLANMSHEIRTPLNGILGFSSLLEIELAIIDQPELFEYANSIQKSGDRLLHLLNNIIDISRLEANDIEMELASCDLSEILEKVIEPCQFRANDKGLRIIKDISPCSVSADYPTLTRILNEIIDNAVKYTEKGFIKISVKVKEENNIVNIQIRDTGIGIDESYLPHIYEAFRQDGLGYSRQYQGAGLGIPLAKRLTHKMGGKLSIESEKSVGTTITIELPLVNEVIQIKKPEIVVPETAINLLSGKNIFVVEDDYSSRKILVKILGKYATVVEAENGENALEIIGKKMEDNVFFDLFLFDINLPAPWDGIKLMGAFKNKYEIYKESPFIAQTAYSMAGDKERLLEAGFNGYISKPIKREELYKTISAVFTENQIS